MTVCRIHFSHPRMLDPLLFAKFDAQPLPRRVFFLTAFCALLRKNMPDETKPRPTIYYVDGKRQATSQDELTVEQILEKAGVRKEAEAEAGALLWEAANPEPVPHESLDEKIRIHDGEQFVTLAGALASLGPRLSPDAAAKKPSSKSSPDRPGFTPRSLRIAVRRCTSRAPSRRPESRGRGRCGGSFA